MLKKIVILISGTGSNLQAIVRAQIPNTLIAAVISDRAEAGGLKWAQSQGLNTFCLPPSDFPSREAYDIALQRLIEPLQPNLIVLAGFMRILGEAFCNYYQGRIMNIHPSLLPAFPGLHTHRSAIEAGCKFTGCTVHFVTPTLDCGPIIIQAVVPVLSDDTPESLRCRVLTQEHLIYPMAISDFVSDHLTIRGNLVINHRISFKQVPALIHF
ncbi:MAG: phosphoribosylglycinamide formyltransferase [Neisseriaceae bacterium]